LHGDDDDRTATEEELSSLRPLAFCGLGNPRAFFRTLEISGIPVADQRIFPDHHRYEEGELAALEKAARAQGANCLVTTEKDWVNLPSGANPTLPLYWAEIEFMVEEEAGLLRWISDRLELPIAGISCSSENEAGSSQNGFVSEGKPVRL
jgi:tetraacyldisaccharide 4'-kinase